MIADEIKIKYIGGPTALLEVGGLRFLTDPTFDPKDSIYDTGLYVLHKLSDHLTMTVDESIKVAELFNKAKIVPLHFEGWEHFTESATEIENKFKDAGLLHRLQWAE